MASIELDREQLRRLFDEAFSEVSEGHLKSLNARVDSLNNTLDSINNSLSNAIESVGHLRSVEFGESHDRTKSEERGVAFAHRVHSVTGSFWKKW